MIRYTVELTELEQQILKHQLLNVNEWIQGAVRGKINKCRKAMLQEASRALLSDPDTENIPATEEGVLSTFMSMTGYKNREDRELESMTDLLEAEHESV